MSIGKGHMKKLPLGIQNFKEIMDGGYIYADKTKYIYDLINSAKYYFLSRPRRFGKSLLLDTIGEVFNGDRELFKGLWIYDSGYDFVRHPVLRLDMSNISNKTPDILEKSLLSALTNRIKEEDLDIYDTIPSDMFKHVIEALYRKYNQKIVVLIDEYDKPILDHLTDVKAAEANSMVIKGFYGILKSMDRFLKFTMITGVSKFTKTSIFSELNNLLDITMMEQYANICGFEVENLEIYFGEHIRALPDYMKPPNIGGSGKEGAGDGNGGDSGGNVSRSDGGDDSRAGGDENNVGGNINRGVGGSNNKNGSADIGDGNGGNVSRSGGGDSGGGWLNAILSWYDGYSWDGRTRVINPFSLLSFFMHKKIGSFWYSSGSPKFLIDLMKKSPEIYVNLRNMEITESMLDSAEFDKIAPEPLLFQTGYLTVKEVQSDSWSPPVYVLDIPNLEVRDAFSLHVISDFTESGQVRAGKAKIEILKALRDNDMQKILEILRGLFASIPYELHIDKEAYYHSIFYAVMTVLGFDIDAEVSTSKGRVDAVLEQSDKVYIIEFKYKDSNPALTEAEKLNIADAALNEGMIQIKNRGYHKKYTGSGKIVHLAVFVFLGRDDVYMLTEK